MTAVRFEREFRRAFSEIEFNGRGRSAWTKAMYRVLHCVAGRWPLWCECRRKRHKGQRGTVRGERLHIDFFWYPLGTGTDGRYDCPRIVIEHENLEGRLAYNLWKVSQIAAPLRVLIGYAKTEEQIDSVAADLMRLAVRHRLPRPSGCEDLLLLSDYKFTTRFRAWHRRDSESWDTVRKRHKLRRVGQH